jgi:hypothetical protein
MRRADAHAAPNSGPPPWHILPVSYQVNSEILALDLEAGFLREDSIGVAAHWEMVCQLAEGAAATGVVC